MKSIMKKYPLVSYFVLAYLLSWLLWVPLAIVNNISEVPEALMLLLFVGIWGPTVAGFIMTRVVDGREGVSRLWAWYPLFLFTQQRISRSTRMGISPI